MRLVQHTTTAHRPSRQGALTVSGAADGAPDARRPRTHEARLRQLPRPRSPRPRLPHGSVRSCGLTDGPAHGTAGPLREGGGIPCGVSVQCRWLVRMSSRTNGELARRSRTWRNHTWLGRSCAANTVAVAGMYRVGTDLQPGTYKADASNGCYYARLSSRNSSDIIDNNTVSGPVVIQVLPNAAALKLSGCGVPPRPEVHSPRGGIREWTEVHRGDLRLHDLVFAETPPSPPRHRRARLSRQQGRGRRRCAGPDRQGSGRATEPPT